MKYNVELFPARAGVILTTIGNLWEKYAVPRTRGGDPFGCSEI